MSTGSWLLRDSERPAPAIDRMAIRAALGALERTFSDGVKARAGVDKAVGKWGPTHDAAIDALREGLDGAIADGHAAVMAAFDAAEGQAQAAIAHARRSFATSEDGRLYWAALAAFGSLPADSDLIAARIADAATAGITGEVRALFDVARAKGVDGHGAVMAAAERHGHARYSANERAALEDAATLADQRETYGMWAYFNRDRATAIVDGDGDFRAGNLNPDRILDGNL